MKKSIKLSKKAPGINKNGLGKGQCTCANCTCVNCACESSNSGHCTCGSACNSNSRKG